MKSRAQLAVLLLLLTPALCPAIDLKPETLQSWNDYILAARTRMEDRTKGRATFLWLDEEQDRAQRVKEGGILVEPAGGNSPHTVPGGLIHDWIAAVFIPKAKLEDVMGVLDDYEHYQDIYKPMVAKSSLLQRTPGHERVALVMVQKAYSVTAAVETENEVEIARLNDARAYSFSASVRVQDIADYGESTEHALPIDHGRGYVWRMCTVTRVEQRNDGVYVEMELMGLSRGIPWVFRWLVQPLAERLPRSILQAILNDTRDAVNEKIKPATPKTPVTAQPTVHP